MVRVHLCLSLRQVLVFMLCVSGFWAGMQKEANAADLAVVIDDVGYNKMLGLRAVNLPDQVTLAVLPFAPHTRSLLPLAVDAGHEILIHQPMQPQPSPHARHEHDTLTLDMSAEEFGGMLRRADEAVPVRLGVSNHTGSLLTAHYPPMLMLMRHLRERGLFFLDSRTTAQTVALRAADEVGVVALKRDVFLDNVRTRSAIDKQFRQALNKARSQGYAILIGHPYGVSLDYLEARLANLPADVSLVKLSELANRRRAVLAQAPDPASPRISLGQ
ncbi:MAG: divergent polysaccharide deacetylase family protein [Pseudomonadales bacterium]